jgi:hypothetical protein
MIVVMLLGGIASLLWGERLPVGDGLGWDGQNYAAWAKDFNKSIFVDKVNDYYVQRIAPSAVVHFGTKQLLRPFYSHHQIHDILAQNKNIILAFGIYNLALLVLSVWIWGRIADHLAMTNLGKWFGFCALFVNYAIAKSNTYQPVILDTSAFFLGLLMFHFFLKRNSWGLLAVIIISGFTWPTMPVMAALLLVLPRPDRELSPAPVTSATTRLISMGLAVLVTLGVGLLFVYLVRHNVMQGWDRAEMVRINFALLHVSIAATLAYIFVGFRQVLNDGHLFNLPSIIRIIQWKWVAATLVVLFLQRIAYHRLQGPLPSIWQFSDFIWYTFISSLSEPFIFLVAHAVYYGPIILLLAIFWRPFCERASSLGVGFKLFVILNLALSICPQSRYQIPAVAAFAIVMVWIVDGWRLNRWQLAFWVLLSLLYSKVWYTFNTGPMNPTGMASLLSFPLQHFFMNSGPWMSHSMYLVQGAVVLATLVALLIMVKVRPRPVDENQLSAMA